MKAFRRLFTLARRRVGEVVATIILTGLAVAALAIVASHPALRRDGLEFAAIAIVALGLLAVVATREDATAARAGGRLLRAVGYALRPRKQQARRVEARPRGSGLDPGTPVIGYLMMSGDERHARDHAEAAIVQTCALARWQLVEIVRDRETSGRSLERPGITYALSRIAWGEARALVVGDITRVCRSIVDLGALVEWFADADAVLIAVDLGVDTSTAEGQKVAEVIMRLAAAEHDRIADRTRERLANLKAEGRAIGRPAVGDWPELRRRILAMRKAKMSLQAIADTLNAEGIPTVRGGARWRPSSVQRTLGYRRPGDRRVKQDTAPSANGE
jgi:DNA invertase Pin-like site-specific DNA recombinase